MNNARYNNNSVSIHQTEFDADNLETNIVTTLKQEYVYETELITKDRNVSTEEKIELSRQAMYKYIGGTLVVCVFFYIVRVWRKSPLRVK